MHSDSVQKEYSRLAPLYDCRWSFYIDAIIQETINRLEIKHQDRILDLVCGTGTLVRYLLDLVPETKFVGLDLSVEMLNIAKLKLPDSVKLLVGSANNLPFPDESFDTVILTNAFHDFHNLYQVIQKATRILKPNGRLVITDWCYDYWTCRLCNFFLCLFKRAHFRTYGVRECQKILQSEGLYEVSVERYKIDWLWGIMTAQAAREA